jgi:hypothetical protein
VGFVRYLHRDAGETSWIKETVDPEHPALHRGSSIALDSAGRPHVLYRSSDREALFYGHRTRSGRWDMR